MLFIRWKVLLLLKKHRPRSWKGFFCSRSTAHGRGKASSAQEAPPTVVESTSFAQEAPSTVGKALLLLKKHRPRSWKALLAIY